MRLLLEAEELEEELAKRECTYEPMGRELRKRKEEEAGSLETLMMELFSIVTPAGCEEEALAKLEEELKRVTDRGLALRDKRHRLHLRSKAISEELGEVERELTAHRESHPQGRQLI